MTRKPTKTCIIEETHPPVTVVVYSVTPPQSKALFQKAPKGRKVRKLDKPVPTNKSTKDSPFKGKVSTGQKDGLVELESYLVA